MKTNSGYSLKFVSLLIALSFVFANYSYALTAMKYGEGNGMTMHHQHIMLNHALGMLLEGSNLLMLGQMGMAKGVDDISVDHGKMMMKNARSLYDEIMSDDTMMMMHAEGKTPEKDTGMKFTHELAETQLKVMSLLETMPTITK